MKKLVTLLLFIFVTSNSLVLPMKRQCEFHTYEPNKPVTQSSKILFTCYHAGCNKTFSTWRELKEHSKDHDGSHHYKCNFCETSYAQKTRLNKHIKIKHSNISGIAAKHTDTIHAEHQEPGMHSTQGPATQQHSSSAELEQNNHFDFSDDHHVTSDYPLEALYFDLENNFFDDIPKYQPDSINQKCESLHQETNHEDNYDDVDRYFQMPSVSQPAQAEQQAQAIEVNRITAAVVMRSSLPQQTTHHNNQLSRPRIKCAFIGCDDSFTCNTSMRTHFELHNHDNMFKCETCVYSAGSRGAFNNHLKNHAEQRVQVPDTSGLVTQQVQVFQQPQQVIHSCQRVTEVSSDVYNQPDSNSKKSFTCTHPGCNKAFDRKDTLYRHIQETHNKN